MPMVHLGRQPWWKGARGEWYVVVQVALIVLVLVGPRTLFGVPGRPFPFPRACSVAGVVLMALGIGLLLASLVRLRHGLTPLPYPREGSMLIQTGPYGLVRHPMYAGGFVFALGWALVVHGWFTLVYAAILLVFIDVKTRLEERWLMEKFPEYGAYKRRVPKLVPFVY